MYSKSSDPLIPRVGLIELVACLMNFLSGIYLDFGKGALDPTWKRTIIYIFN